MAVTKTETFLQNLKFNQLTKSQYDAALEAGEISQEEFYLVEEADSSGGGDMEKSVYDTNNNNIVDKAEGLEVTSGQVIFKNNINKNYIVSQNAPGILTVAYKNNLDGTTVNLVSIANDEITILNGKLIYDEGTY